MKRSASKGRTSLRRRILLGSVSLVLTVVLGAGMVVWTESRRRAEFYEATEAFLEEQGIAEKIEQVVARQVMAASLFAVRGDPSLMDEVRTAGDTAHVLIRTYLFRDLTPEQRLKLEAVKEAHQRLEVTASRMQLQERGASTGSGGEAALEVPIEVIREARILQSRVDDFLSLRESDVDELRRRQATLFRGLHLAWGALAALLLGITIPFARFLHRRLVDPLTTLAGVAGRVEEGDLDARVELAHDDELAALGESFNGMLDTLQEARDRLEAKNRELEEAMARLREAQADLVQSEKLSAVGEMLAGLAHELNNPLASVVGYAELLQEELDSSDPPSSHAELADSVEPLLAEAARARELVGSLLRFSRKSQGTLAPVRLEEALRNVERLRTYSFDQAGLALEIPRVPDVWVRAEPQALQQVFVNLINNAYDALDEAGRGGALRVSVKARDDDVHLVFADDGPGFVDPQRALDPFFTTKAPGEGTGLGLALVHRLVREFGGSMRIANAPRGGARIHLVFRRVEAPPSSASASASGGEPWHPGKVDLAGATILVAEDEKPLRNLQKRVLGRAHASVIAVDTGEGALRVLCERDVDLVISDVKMPGRVDGLELFRRVEREWPELVGRFLFVTGDTAQPYLSEVSARLPGQVIEKPFSLEEYLRRVRDLLMRDAPADGDTDRAPRLSECAGIPEGQEGGGRAVPDERHQVELFREP